jgi:NADPH:quinone reductase-like Zn-dependent oxidoreductase
MAKELEVYGVALLTATSADLKEMGSYVTAALESGVLSPVVGQELPLQQASLAHQEVINRSTIAAGNIVLIP